MQKVRNTYQTAGSLKRISKTAVLKYISGIYSDKLKNLNQNKSPLYIIAYEVFLQKYGLKSVSENKYCHVSFFRISIKHLNVLKILHKLLETALRLINIPKVYTFCRLMNLIDSYQSDECNFYFMSLKYLDEM